MRNALFSLLLAGAALSSAKPEPGMMDGYSAALDSNKALVVYFFQDRNPECARFEREVLPAAYGYDAVVARQNASMDDANGNVAKVIANHKVHVFPSVLVFSCKPGTVTEIGRFDGFVDADTFRTRLGEVLGQDAPKQVTVPAAGPHADDAALERMLKAQGFAVTAKATPDGPTVYRVDFRRGDKQYFLNIAYAGSRKVLWVWAPLGEKEARRGDAARLQKLLEKSWDLAPIHFQMDEVLLSLALALDAGSVDATRLADAAQKVLDGMIETEPLWRIGA